MNVTFAVRPSAGENLAGKSDPVEPSVVQAPAESSSSCEAAAGPNGAVTVTDPRRDSESKEGEAEVSATGVVKLSVYYEYWKSVGHGLVTLILVSVIGMQVNFALERSGWRLSECISYQVSLFLGFSYRCRLVAVGVGHG